jgi:FkbM family methyltransferase
VKLDVTPAQLAEELNSAVAQLDFTFVANKRRARLQLPDGKRIVFPSDAGGEVRGGAYHWLRTKHRNGAIHEPAMVASFVALANRLADESIVFFDVGALYGYFALLWKSLHRDSTALAFEVNPESYDGLRENVAANEHLGRPAVHCCRVGLSDQTRLGHSASVKGIKLNEDTDAGDTVVDLMRLDDFSRITGFLPDVMKIDVEGYQARIMPGAMETIRQGEPIILMEFDQPETLESFGRTNRDVVAPLFDLGYSMLWTSDHRHAGGIFEVLSLHDLTDEHETNSLAVFAHLSG